MFKIEGNMVRPGDEFGIAVPTGSEVRIEGNRIIDSEDPELAVIIKSDSSP